ncbi:MAG: ThiF family adenylyltransferase [Kiritimatiellae bacterium]|jgi:hypothetical protein|nr:ThiF family adenylyltransferase [Kiritimatiellia bacterium]
MSQQLISHNKDLKRLRDDGFDVGIVENHLVVRNIPYVTPQKEIKYGTLVSSLDLSGEKTVRPRTHVAMFCGEHPCETDGTKIKGIINGSGQKALGPELTIDHTFSAKPSEGYSNYHHKMSTYCAIISGPAKTLDPSVTAQPHLPIVTAKEDSVFNYLDTASSRAGIGAVTEKLHVAKIAIVGLGGTGSYILDLVAKTPVEEIHLFDGDDFLSHNAFRAPGATSIDDLNNHPTKVDYLKNLYDRFRRGIKAHNLYIDKSCLDLLDGMSHVFLCMDGSESKRHIVDYLEAKGIAFIDVGMGIDEADGMLYGQLRVTTSTPSHREHVHSRKLIPYGNSGNNPYDTNIQVADLNALNACLAVVKWKKLLGFYCDLEKEHHCVYQIDGNHLINEETE